MKRLFAFLALFLVFPAVHAATCSSTGATLPFYRYVITDAVSSTVNTQASITCTGLSTQESQSGVIVRISLGGSAGTYTDRYMTAPGVTERLRYNVYQDPALAFPVGDTAGGQANITACIGSSACGSGSASTPSDTLTLTLYGAAPPHQDVPVSLEYSDHLTLTLSY